jgi:hypothetical protein
MQDSGRITPYLIVLTYMACITQAFTSSLNNHISSRFNTNTTQTVTTKSDRVRLPLPSRMCEVAKAQHSNDLYVTCSTMSFFSYIFEHSLSRKTALINFQISVLRMQESKQNKNILMQHIGNFNYYCYNIYLIVLWGVHNITRKKTITPRSQQT